MSHRYHPDPDRPQPVGPTGDPEDAALFDNCERCDEHAKDLSELDNDTLQRIRIRHREGIQTITINERRARYLIDNAYQVVIRIEGAGRLPVLEAGNEDGEVEAILGQINAATANTFLEDPATPAGSDTQFWYRTERARLVLRGLDGASLHVFTGPIEARGTVLSFSVRFDGNIPAEAFEAAIRGAM